MLEPEVRLIAIGEVKQIVGLSKSEIWRRVGAGAGSFPQPVSLGPQTTRWNYPEIRAWTDARLAERDAQAAQRAQRRLERQSQKLPMQAVAA